MSLFRFLAFVFVICITIATLTAIFWSNQHKRHQAELSAKQLIINQKNSEILQLKNQLSQCVSDVNTERLKCDAGGFMPEHSGTRLP